MNTITGIGATAVSSQARHLPIEDGDVLVLTVPRDFSNEEVQFAHTTCQQLREEIAATGKTITTVILPDNCDLKTASRASIQELYGRLGLSLLPGVETFVTDEERAPEHQPERRSQQRKPAFNRRKQPR